MPNTSHIESHREIVFIDAGVEDSHLLAAPIKKQADIVILRGDEDGLLEIQNHLLGRKDLKAIHLISHGGPGWVQAGAIRVDADAAASHAGALRDIGGTLCEGGELLVYGCRAGAGAAGESLVSALQRHAGCRVAANSGPTGSMELGGSWQLDTGMLPAASTLLNGHNMRSYPGLLAAPADQNYDSNGGYSITSDSFTLNGVKYTITGTNSGNYTNIVMNNSAASILGNNAGDYYLFFDLSGAFGISSIKVEAADGSAFRLASLSFDAAADTTIAITPSGGGSAVNFTSNGALQTHQNYSFGTAFDNITSFTFSGGNLAGAFDDLNFEPAVVAGPSVSSIVRTGTALSNGTSVSYTVTFSESVTGVDVNDFALTTTGTAAGTVAAIGGSGSTYTVTVNGASGDGTVRLDLNSSGTGIQNGASAAITAGYTSGQTYTLDHTAPATPAAPAMSGASDSGGSNSDRITNVAAPVFSGTAEANAVVTLYDSDGTTVLGSVTADGSGAYSITSSNLTAGSHSVTVKAVDAAGNSSPASTATSVNIDFTGPTGMAVATSTANTSAATNGATITTLSASDANSISYGFAAGNGVIDADHAKFTISGNALVAAQNLTAGTYHIYLRATDAAGNDAFQTFAIDVIDAPSVASIARTGGAGADVLASTDSVTYTVTFSQAVTGVDAADFAVTASGTAAGNIDAVSGSGTTYTVTVDTLSGDGTLRLDLNASGTGIQNGASVALASGYSSGQSYALDRTAPQVPSAPAMTMASDSGTSNSDAVTADLTPAFTGTGEIGSTVKLYDSDGTTVLGSAVVDGAGNWSITSSTLANGVHQLTARAVDMAGNLSAASGALAALIDAAAASSVAVSSTSVLDNAGLNAVVGQLSNNDTGGGSYVYTLVAGAGDTHNAGFSISGGSLIILNPAEAGARSIRVSVTDAAGNSFEQVLTVQVDSPPTTPPAPVIDGVPVTSTPVVLPGGGAGTQVSVPVIAPGRPETSGSSGVADIPLVSAGGGGNLLLAQLPVGFGLSSLGAPSAPAGNSLEELIRSIVAVTPNHDPADQGHLTSNGATFLQRLPSTVPLLVQTVVPVTASDATSGTLTLTGTSTEQQHTALVIDASNVTPQSTIVLNAVDFAAVVGAATVTGNTAGQILAGDEASQNFFMSASLGGSIYSGGGSDTLRLNGTGPQGGPATGLPAAAGPQADSVPALVQNVLHGGQGGDTAVFAGQRAAYTLTTRDGHLLVSLNAAPEQQALVVNVETLQFADQSIAVENRSALSAITGLYRDVLGRQAEVAGADFWGQLERAGMSLGQIALNFINSTEGQTQQEAFNGNHVHDIGLLYQAIFSRPAEAAGLAFWVNHMEQGMALTEVADRFMHSGEMLTQHNLAPLAWDFI